MKRRRLVRIRPLRIGDRVRLRRGRLWRVVVWVAGEGVKLCAPLSGYRWWHGDELVRVVARHAKAMCPNVDRDARPPF